MSGIWGATHLKPREKNAKGAKNTSTVFEGALRCRFRGWCSSLCTLKCICRGRCSTLWTLRCRLRATWLTLMCRFRFRRTTRWTLKCRFRTSPAALATKSEHAEDHHHVQSTAPERKSVHRHKHPQISCTCHEKSTLDHQNTRCPLRLPPKAITLRLKMFTSPHRERSLEEHPLSSELAGPGREHLDQT